MRKARAIRWTAWLGLLGIVGTLLWRTWPRERLLLPNSVRIEAGARCCTYNWLSPQALLLFQQAPAPSERWSVERVNLPALQHYPLQSLASRLPSNAAHFDTSPDGKWLLWAEAKNTFPTTGPDGKWLQPRARGSLLNLQTEQVRHFPLGLSALTDTFEPHDLFWMADSQHWVEMDFGPFMRALSNAPTLPPSFIRSVDAPQYATQIRLASNQGVESFSSLRVVSAQRLVAATPYLYTKADDIGGMDLPQLIQTNLVSQGSSTRKTVLPLPSETLIVADVTFSPQGDRYALSALVAPRPAWYGRLHRWWPALRMPGHPHVCIWVFSLDGKRSQELGCIVPEQDHAETATHPYHMPSELRWSPDGKQLGFIYKDALYVVSAD